MSGKPTEAPRATRSDEAPRTNAGPGRTPERHATDHNHGTRTGAKPQRPPGAANPGSVHNTRGTAAREKVPRTAGPHARTRYPAPVGSGSRPHARTDERSGVRERPSPDAPHPGKRCPPGAPSCRPHSTQSQHARARGVGLVMGPHTRTPRTHSQWVVGPGRTPEGTSGRGWEIARPRTRGTKAGGAPPGTLMPPPQRAKPARKSTRCGVGDGSPHLQPPHPQPVGSGPRPHARKEQVVEGGRASDPGRPTPREEVPSPGRPCAAPTARKARSQERALWGW